MPKYDFSVQTRNGQKVESVLIFGQDLPDAERKLRQMYMHCEITQCKTVQADNKLSQSVDIEDVLTLISRQE